MILICSNALDLYRIYTCVSKIAKFYENSWHVSYVWSFATIYKTLCIPVYLPFLFFLFNYNNSLFRKKINIQLIGSNTYTNYTVYYIVLVCKCRHGKLHRNYSLCT